MYTLHVEFPNNQYVNIPGLTIIQAIKKARELQRAASMWFIRRPDYGDTCALVWNANGFFTDRAIYSPVVRFSR